MTHARRDAPLVHEALARNAVARQLGAEDLERDHAVESGVLRAIHGAHPAARDHALDLVAAELLTAPQARVVGGGARRRRPVRA